VIPRDIQFDPVKDEVLHLDFLRVGEKTMITVGVPVHFVNDQASPGIKRGGVLNIVRYEVDMVCPAGNMPDALTVDLTGWEVGDSIHISAVQLPEGTRPAITDRDFTIATIAAPSGMKSEAAEG
jgi:large subunit ribosomal protein L25